MMILKNNLKNTSRWLLLYTLFSTFAVNGKVLSEENEKIKDSFARASYLRNSFSTSVQSSLSFPQHENKDNNAYMNQDSLLEQKNEIQFHSTITMTDQEDSSKKKSFSNQSPPIGKESRTSRRLQNYDIDWIRHDTTTYPTSFPTEAPTKTPSTTPTVKPTPFPTAFPTTSNPTHRPTRPTHRPTPYPSQLPTKKPTRTPSTVPTPSPTRYPTAGPTRWPTRQPTSAPTKFQPTPATTPAPTPAPTTAPTPSPTTAPTPSPTPSPTTAPTLSPTPA